MMRAMYVMCVMMPGPLRGMLAMREAGPSEEGLDATRPAASEVLLSRQASSSLGKCGPALFGTRKRPGLLHPGPPRSSSVVVRINPLTNESFGQLREECPYHPFAEPLAAVGLQPARIAFINVHHIQIVAYAIERIGGVLVGVATDLLTLELELHGLLLHV